MSPEDRKLKVNPVFTHRVSGANYFIPVGIRVLLEIIQHSTGLIFFALVYSLKWFSSEVHLPILLISRREYRSSNFETGGGGAPFNIGGGRGAQDTFSY